MVLYGVSYHRIIAFVLTLGSSFSSGDEILFADGFDDDELLAVGISAAYAGGDQTTSGYTGGVTSSQGYDSLPSFADQFWRVTTNDDVLELTLSNIGTHSNVSVAFSLAMMDSWDGGGSTYGADFINFEVTDGSSTLLSFSETYSSGTTPSQGVVATEATQVQLGFNNGSQIWWSDDAYRMEFNDLAHDSDTLVLRFWASSGGSGLGFQGGNDESFAVDNIRVTYDAVPELSSFVLLPISFGGFLLRRRVQR